MAESMTGFGWAFVKETDFAVKVEVRSLNSRGLEISIKGSRELTPSVEREMRHLVRASFERGYFSIHVDVSSIRPPFLRDTSLLKKEVALYREIMRDLGLSPSDDKLLDLITREHPGGLEDEKRVSRAILRGFKKALRDLKRERRIEGRALVKEIRKRLRVIERYLRHIERTKPILIQKIKEDVANRIREMVGKDTERAWIEASILADKADIREEVVRFRSHLERFKEVLKEKGAIGKRLDFLCQEMTREVNTMASKLSALSETVVDIKAEIEKVRQQLHNLE